MDDIDFSGHCYYNNQGVWCHDAWEYKNDYFSYCKYVNITEKLDNAMVENLEYIEELRNQRGIIVADIEFFMKVKPGGVWDYKNQKDWGLSEEKTYIYNDMELRYDDVGNINYGYVGRQQFEEQTLLVFAGFAQIITGHSDWSYYKSNFDDPHDQ